MTALHGAPFIFGNLADTMVMMLQSGCWGPSLFAKGFKEVQSGSSALWVSDGGVRVSSSLHYTGLSTGVVGIGGFRQYYNEYYDPQSPLKALEALIRS